MTAMTVEWPNAVPTSQTAVALRAFTYRIRYLERPEFLFGHWLVAEFGEREVVSNTGVEETPL